MTRHNVELDDFLQVLQKRFAALDGSDANAVLEALKTADVVGLGRETAELQDSVDWLVGTVQTVARFSPSAAFVLASRFAAQRALLEREVDGVDAEDVTAAVVNPAAHTPWTATVPTALTPRAVVLLERHAPSASCAPWSTLLAEDIDGARRSGLRDAAVQTVRLGDTAIALPDAVAHSALHDWDLFTSGVALGLAEQALTTAETYAGERRQFGSAIAAFAGLRAILAEMQLKVSGVRGLLDRAVLGDTDPAEVLAVAGRVAVDVCLDAIQVHGGYGYIDEYPVARMLRDAISLRARGGGRRALLAEVAAHRLGAPEAGS